MQVEELIIYPVKSCAGVNVQEAQMTRYGLALPANPLIFDRRWMIVKDGRQQTQNVLPRMALIRPSFVNDGLCLRAPSMPELHISVDPLPKEVMKCKCWGDDILGLRYGDHVSDWLRTFFETEDEFNLVVFDDKRFEGRSCQKIEVSNVARSGDRVAYHDLSPIHLCSTKSVSDLNTRLKNKIKVYNFRPNIIVTNVEEPYAEDGWRELAIGDVKLTWIAPCARCLVPTINQETGIKDPNQESWKTLRSYRVKPTPFGSSVKPNPYAKSALFGIDMAPTDDESSNGTLLRVGDSVHVIKEDPNFWQSTD